MIWIELLLTLLIIILIVGALCAEFNDMRKGIHPFVLERKIHQELHPQLKDTNSVNGICEFYLSSKMDQPYVWRHCTLIAFTCAILSTLLVKIFTPALPYITFMLLFLIIFFILFLFLSLLHFHYLGSKYVFIKACFEKIKRLSVIQ